MDVIHFTYGATDPLNSGDAQGVRFLPLADGQGDCHLGCVHLDPGAKLAAPSLTHAAALLVVHGRINLTNEEPFVRLQVHAGMGCVFDKHQPYSLDTEVGAIVLIVESDTLAAHARGISSPDRIVGQTWPSDILLPPSKAFP
jgi:hypothetical protein